MPFEPPTQSVASGAPPIAQRFAKPLPGAFGGSIEIVFFPADDAASVGGVTIAASGCTTCASCFIGALSPLEHAKTTTSVRRRVLVCRRRGVAIDPARTLSAPRADRRGRQRLRLSRDGADRRRRG